MDQDVPPGNGYKSYFRENSSGKKSSRIHFVKDKILSEKHFVGENIQLGKIISGHCGPLRATAGNKVTNQLLLRDVVNNSCEVWKEVHEHSEADQLLLYPNMEPLT